MGGTQSKRDRQRTAKESGQGKKDQQVENGNAGNLESYDKGFRASSIDTARRHPGFVRQTRIYGQMYGQIFCLRRHATLHFLAPLLVLRNSIRNSIRLPRMSTSLISAFSAWNMITRRIGFFSFFGVFDCKLFFSWLKASQARNQPHRSSASFAVLELTEMDIGHILDLS